MMVFMMDGGSEFLHSGYTILSGFLDLMFSPEQTWKAAGMREKFPGTETIALGECVF